MKKIFQMATCRTRPILDRIVKLARKDNIDLNWSVKDCMDKSYPFLIETETAIENLFSENNIEPDLMLIEISTIKHDKHTKLTKDQFINWVNRMINIIPNRTQIIWVSAHNIQLSQAHYDIVSTGTGIRSVDGSSSIFSADRRFKQRVDCENWLEQAVNDHDNCIFIKTSDCFKKYNSEFVFQCVENTPHMPADKAANTVDTYHYHRSAEPVLLEFVYDKIKHIL